MMLQVGLTDTLTRSVVTTMVGVYFDICRTNIDKRALKMFKKVKWNPERGEEEEIVEEKVQVQK